MHNDRLIDALTLQAFPALTQSPGAHAHYQQQSAHSAGHNAALRQLANRLAGILHSCLKTRTAYNETTAGATESKARVAAGELSHLPAASQHALTGRTFFPELIAAPFHHGLTIVFGVAAGLAAIVECYDDA